MIEFNTPDDALAYLGVPYAETAAPFAQYTERSESINVSGGNFLFITYLSLKATASPAKGIFYQQNLLANTITLQTSNTLTTGSLVFAIGGLSLDLFNDLDDIPTGDTSTTRRSYNLLCLIVRVTTSGGLTTVEMSGRQVGGAGWVDNSITDVTPTIAAAGANTTSGFGTAPVLEASQVGIKHPDKPATMAIHPLRISTYANAAAVPTIADCKTNFWPYMESILDHPTGWGTWVDTWLLVNCPITSLASTYVGATFNIAEVQYDGINCPVTITSYPAYWEGPGFLNGFKRASPGQGALGQIISAATAFTPTNVVVGTHIHRDPYVFFSGLITERLGTLFPYTIAGALTGSGVAPKLKRLVDATLNGTSLNEQLWVACCGQSWCNYGDKSKVNINLSDVNDFYTMGCDLRQGLTARCLNNLVGIFYDLIPIANSSAIEQSQKRLGFTTSGTYPNYDYYWVANSKSTTGTYSISDQQRTWFYRFTFGSRNIPSPTSAFPPTDRYCGGGPVYIGGSNAADQDECAFCAELPANSRGKTYIDAQSAGNKNVTRVDLLLQYPGAPDSVWYQGQAVSTRNNVMPGGVIPTGIPDALNPGVNGYTQLTGNDLTVQTGTLVRSGGTVPTFGASDPIAWMTSDDFIHVDGMADDPTMTAEIDAFRLDSLNADKEWWAVFHPASGEGALITKATYNSGVAGRWKFETGRVFMVGGRAAPSGQCGFSTDITNAAVWQNGDVIKVGRVRWRAVSAVININANPLARICWLRFGSGGGANYSPGGPMVVFPGGIYVAGLNGVVTNGGGSGSLNYERVDNSLMPGAVQKIHRAVRRPDICILQQTLQTADPGAQQRWFQVAINRNRSMNPNVELAAVFIPAWNGRNQTSLGQWVFNPNVITATRADFRLDFTTNGITYVDAYNIYDTSVSIMKGHMADMTHFNGQGNISIINIAFESWQDSIIPGGSGSNFWKLELTGSLQG